MFALCLLIAGQSLSAPEPLTTAQAVRELSREQAEANPRVKLTGVVTYVSPTTQDFFLQDETAGIYLDQSAHAAGLAVGDRVTVEGTALPGTFAPAVRPDREVVKHDTESLPDPEPYDLNADDNRWLDARYVHCRVYVQAAEATGADLRLAVATAKGSARLVLRGMAAELPRARLLVNSVVAVRGVCGPPRHDPKTRLAERGGRLFVNSLADIRPLRKARGDDAPVPIGHVERGFLSGPAPFARPVTVRGVVTYAAVRGGVQTVVIQDETGVARVTPSEPIQARVGETVAIAGFIAPEPTGLHLDNAAIPDGPPQPAPKLPPLPAPAPVATTADQVARRSRWAGLVRVEGEVRSSVYSDGERIVSCREGGERFTVVLVSANDPQASLALEPGTRVRVTGVVTPAGVAEDGAADGFRLLLRTPADVEVLGVPPEPAVPSWWNGEKVLWFTNGLAAVALVVAGWILLLRRQVRRQTAEIRAHFEREAKLERSLQESRRLEAVGRLVGGIAHDFNNLLTVIINGSELAAQAYPADAGGRVMLESVRLAGERAADLTGQLLLFAGRRDVALARLDLNAVLREAEKLVRPTAGDGVRVATAYDDRVPAIRADAGLLTQIVLNLATNARDAMPGGGQLEVRTELVEGGGEPAARLIVSDTGCGMDAATQARVFEPFFTTKEAGKGTGLGLATVADIVKELGGTVAVRSVVGEGTTFTLTFPADVEAEPVPFPAEPPPAAPPPAVAPTGMILLVDDEEQVRRMCGQSLRKFGYTVVEAETPEAALELVRRTPAAFALLVTDVVMHGMNGPALAEHVRALCPALPVLFISGYTAQELPPSGAVGAGHRLLTKPFTPTELAAAVREVLPRDRPAA